MQRYHDEGDEFLNRIVTGDETWVSIHYPRNQAAVNTLALQWISLQDEIQADFVGVQSDVHGVLRETGSNPRRQTSTT